MKRWFVCLLALVFAVACSNGGEEEVIEITDDNPFGQTVDEWGRPVLDGTGYEDPLSKDDALAGKRGLPISVDSSSTAVWEVKNAWADTDTAEARKAGIAWGENSGLTWEEKFTAWVGSLEKIDKAGGFGETFMLKTPYGFDVPSPTLECAEVAMFLRVTFASWYNLPFFMEAVQSGGERVFFGHFGIRTANGRHPQMPNFKTRYQDHSHLADGVRAGTTAWPVDNTLAGRKLAGGFDDEQEALGEGQHAGAYFDKIFLNKRVGYYLLVHLAFLGSVNLADSANTFNIFPWSIRPGDTLLERWAKTGIGHTLVLMRVRQLGEVEVDGQTVPMLEAELASGSMPRRQPSWESPASSKRTFTLEAAGGGDKAAFGGGIKRWRATVNVRGTWTNMVLEPDVDAWINSTDLEAIGARPDQFETVLSSLTPAEKVVALADIIESKRQHLRQFPASCSARINREAVFDEMYALQAEEFGKSKEEVDREFRTFEDYVFAELVYDKSKTCCWNSSTGAMYDLVMQLNEQQVYDEATGTCNNVLVFKNRDDGSDGFDVFRQFAVEQGRGADWVDWREDEPCAALNIPEATEEEHVWTPLCDLASDIPIRTEEGTGG